MDSATRRHVRKRADERCEYCRLPQAVAALIPFHIEHVRAKQHRGGDEVENLALACPDCNRFKGPNLSAIDPESGVIVSLFNPRVDSWETHFTLVGAEIIGLTPIGRAAASLLRMNEQSRLKMRAELLRHGELCG
jgi:hypothetical protein